MIIYLAGVSCVGKTTIGKELAKQNHWQFFDLDEQVEQYYHLSIERLQNLYGGMSGYRQQAVKVLQQILISNLNGIILIALSPAGLMRPYLKTVQESKGVVVLLQDSHKNILERLAFFDIDSKPMNVLISPEQKPLYLRNIKRDIAYYKRSFKHAHLVVEINNLSILESVEKITRVLHESKKIP